MCENALHTTKVKEMPTDPEMYPKTTVERETYSGEETSIKLDMGINHTYAAIHSGEIRALRFGKSYRISKVWLDGVLAAGHNPVTGK